jgi:hypothetical protein
VILTQEVRRVTESSCDALAARGAKVAELVLERLDSSSQILYHQVKRVESQMPVIDEGAQPPKHHAGVVDPLAQARLVGRAQRDLEVAVDDAPVLELRSASQHVVVCGLYVGFTSTL